MLTCAEMWEHKWLYVEGLINTLPPSDAVLWWWFNCTGMAWSVNILTGPRSGRQKHAANQVDGGDLVILFARSKGNPNSWALNGNFREYNQRTPTSYRQPIGVRWEVLIYLRLVLDHDVDTLGRRLATKPTSPDAKHQHANNKRIMSQVDPTAVFLTINIFSHNTTTPG